MLGRNRNNERKRNDRKGKGVSQVCQVGALKPVPTTPSRLSELLEIPVELSTDNPKITVVGFEQLYIENHKGILEYQDYFVRLNTNIGIVNINGFNLELAEMTSDDILVTGKIDSIDFESTVDEEE